MVWYILLIVLVAFAFDYINGFHDAANSIATIVGTRVLTPMAAVVWAAFFNFVALFFFGTSVAKTIGKDLIDLAVVNQNVVFAGLLGAIAWNLITWWRGIPSSSTHALLGGYAGAAVAKAGTFSAIIYSGWTKTIIFIFLSPMIGLVFGMGLMIAVYWLLHKVRPGKVNHVFQKMQLLSAAAFSLSHGTNDAQKTMGIIFSLLLTSNAYFAGKTGFLSHFYVAPGEGIPLWVKAGAHIAIAAGTLFGGWRIVHTMGSRVTKLRPVGGFCAETGGAASIFIATAFGIPVSTTHTITGAIVGVGVANRISAVRWGVAGRIVWAWILTIPASAMIAALCYLLAIRYVSIS